MGDRASINLNEHHVRGLLERDDLDLNKFYRADLITFIETLRKDLRVSKSRIDKAIPMLKDLNIKLKDILKIGIDVKEISDIENILQGEDTNVNIAN